MPGLRIPGPTGPAFAVATGLGRAYSLVPPSIHSVSLPVFSVELFEEPLLNFVSLNGLKAEL